MIRTSFGLAALVVVPALLGSWPLFLVGLVAGLIAVGMLGARAGATGAPVRQARPGRRRGWRYPSLGVGLALPLPGPLYAFLTLFRVRR